MGNSIWIWKHQPEIQWLVGCYRAKLLQCLGQSEQWFLTCILLHSDVLAGNASACSAGNWSLSPDWIFHHHIDQTCTGYNPYSGAVLALNEASGWVLQQLARSPLSTEALEFALCGEAAKTADTELRRFLDVTLNSLHEDARVIILSTHS